MSYISKFYMGIVSIAMGSWMLSISFVYNYLNNKRENLVLFWLSLTYEIEVKNDNDYKVMGLSKEKNKKFWTKENELNHQFFKTINLFALITNLIFDSQYFLLRYDVDLFTHSIITTIHIIHMSIFVYLMFQVVYTLNFFFLTITSFFTTKFKYISKQLNKFLIEPFNANSDQNLSQLIYEINYVYYELLNINLFFKFLNGINLIHYFLVAILGTFAFMTMNSFVQIGGYSILVFLYILVLFLPSKFSNKVSIEVSAFRPSNRPSKLDD